MELPWLPVAAVLEEETIKRAGSAGLACQLFKGAGVLVTTQTEDLRRFVSFEHSEGVFSAFEHLKRVGKVAN
jgi:hypothetical protein